MRKLAIMCITFDSEVEPSILTWLSGTKERAEAQGIPCTFIVSNADDIDLDVDEIKLHSLVKPANC